MCTDFFIIEIQTLQYLIFCFRNSSIFLHLLPFHLSHLSFSRFLLFPTSSLSFISSYIFYILHPPSSYILFPFIYLILHILPLPPSSFIFFPFIYLMTVGTTFPRKNHLTDSSIFLHHLPFH